MAKKRATVELGEGADGHDASCECGFRTIGWATKRDAQERLAAHQEEHETGEPTMELYEWIAGEAHPDWR